MATVESNKYMIAFVVGTRPEFIKIAPVVDALTRRGAKFAIIHTGQHYSYELDALFFEDLGLPQPIANLEVGSPPAAEQLGRIIIRTAHVLAESKPTWVLVQGDTNSVLGGALAANKLGLPVAHLEAGLRSDDWGMPEEANRVLTGRIAAMHLCPTELQARRLSLEGIVRGVHIVGNTVVDAVLLNARRDRRSNSTLNDARLFAKPYALVNLHRPSNVDAEDRLLSVMLALRAVADRNGFSIVFPAHPRTRATLARMPASELFSKSPFIIIDPVGYIDFLHLLSNAQIALTDSGGVQEEACTLHIPCVTLRASTERPETVSVGANMLCHSTSEGKLEAAVETMLHHPRNWDNPLGDGRAGERVADLLLNKSARRVPSGAP